jgi:hypothetical protein
MKYLPYPCLESLLMLLAPKKERAPFPIQGIPHEKSLFLLCEIGYGRKRDNNSNKFRA